MTVCVPAASVPVEIAAVPPDKATGDPKVAPSTENVTDPPGAATPGGREVVPDRLEVKVIA